MTEQPLVTVAIPTFKRPDLLRQALESALSQTYRNTEILVSDSASSEEIAELVAGYSDPRTRYRHNEVVTTSWQNALNMYRDARGTLVATLHDDDLWERTFLEELVATLVADPALVLAFSDHYMMDQAGVVSTKATEANTRRWGRKSLEEGIHRPFYDLALVRRSLPFGVATVFRKDVIDWTDCPGQVGAAYDLWLAYLAARDGGGAYYSRKRLTRYRAHPDSTTLTSRREAELVFCYDRFLKDERLRPAHGQLRRASARYRSSAGISLLRENRTPEGRRQLLDGIRCGAVATGSFGLAISVLPQSARMWAVDVIRTAVHAGLLKHVRTTRGPESRPPSG